MAWPRGWMLRQHHRHSMSASAPTTAAFLKSKPEVGFRLQSAKSVFWGGTGDEESEEDGESNESDSDDLNAQFTLLTEKS